MEIRWYRKGNSAGGDSAQLRQLPSQAAEDAPDTALRERRYATWMDEIVREHAAQGGFDDLDGKGRPLSLDNSGGEFMVNRIMKNAGVLPPWLELQHDIGKRVQALLKRLDTHPDLDVTSDLEEINQKIHKYNRLCPSTLLYKAPLTRANLAQQAVHWTSPTEGVE
ncbi:MAG: DUF1992 domain-containing protein [Alicyclobacillus sp.]|nr:DUF1992 domain-containing protein [Alicyclobacillus sp.]